MSPELVVATSGKEELVDVTREVAAAVARAGWAGGAVAISVPHTTCAITLNEGADPDVAADIVAGLTAIVTDRVSYRHAEGNSPAHIKATLVGSCVLVPLAARGELRLGTWQRVFLCEFDGPRRRRVRLTHLAGGPAP